MKYENLSLLGTHYLINYNKVADLWNLNPQVQSVWFKKIWVSKHSLSFYVMADKIASLV